MGLMRRRGHTTIPYPPNIRNPAALPAAKRALAMPCLQTPEEGDFGILEAATGSPPAGSDGQWTPAGLAPTAS